MQAGGATLEPLTLEPFEIAGSDPSLPLLPTTIFKNRSSTSNDHDDRLPRRILPAGKRGLRAWSVYLRSRVTVWTRGLTPRPPLDLSQQPLLLPPVRPPLPPTDLTFAQADEVTPICLQ